MSLSTELIVRIHNAERSKLATRAIASALADDQTGVIVIAHNVSRDELGIKSSERIRICEVTGGHGRPGVASQAGIEVATAR